jgi:hypothetical protein
MPYENAHAARIDDDYIVREVIVIPYCNDDDAEITAYCNGIGLAGTWIDTSYLGSRRGKYAGIGDTYDADLDEFVSPVAPEPDEPAETD